MTVRALFVLIGYRRENGDSEQLVRDDDRRPFCRVHCHRRDQLPISGNNAALAISSIQPSRSTQGASGTITVNGANLARATLSRTGITFSGHQYVPSDGTKLTATFTVDSMAPQKSLLSVTNPVGTTTAS